MIGPHVPLDKLLGREVAIIRWALRPSTQQRGEDCLYIQLKIREGDQWKEYMTWTSSEVLRNELEAIPRDNYPFVAAIKQQKSKTTGRDYYYLTDPD